MEALIKTHTPPLSRHSLFAVNPDNGDGVQKCRGGSIVSLDAR